jgi:hypothetical protein
LKAPRVGLNLALSPPCTSAPSPPSSPSAATLALGAVAAHAADNTLTAAEKKAGWVLLFDGQTLNGWRPYANKPAGGWEVKDGTLHAIAKVKGVELITEKKYDNFEFSWEWKLPPAGNNGVKYFVTEKRPGAPGHEYQMIDDDAPKWAKLHAESKTASFYEVLPPAADRPLNPPGQWNRSRLVVRGQTVEHWLNDRKVLTYELGSAAVKAGIAKSKFNKFPDFGEKLRGHVMLTYHQDDCWYKNIKIRELK